MLRLFAFSSLLCLAQPALAEPEKEQAAPGLVVLDVGMGPGVSEKLAQLLGEVLLVNLQQSRAFGTITSSADLQSMLELDQQKAVLGCEDDSCLVQLGGMLGVPYLLRCRVGMVGQSYLVTVHLVGVEAATVVARAMSEAKAEGDLPVAIASAVPRLLADFRQQSAGTALGTPSVVRGSKAWENRWIQRAGYGLGVLGLGLTSLGWLASSAAQAQIDPGPTVVTEREMLEAQAGIDRANRYSLMGFTSMAGGLGLLIWGQLR